MKAFIIVPAFNESQVIYKVIKNLPKKLNGVSNVETILINDGSLDNTIIEVDKLKIHTISHLINRGLGAAIKTGLEFAKSNKADITVTFDGDDQHNPKDIQKLINPILKNNADLVIGSRFKKKQKIPLDRFVINWIANIVTFLFYGVFSTDSQSGLRAFSSKALRLIDIKADKMDFSSEILLEAKRNDLIIKEISIDAIYTVYSRKKGQKNTNAFPILAKLILKILR